MESRKIEIRKLELSDAPEIAKLANNFTIWKNLRDHFPYPYTKSDAEFFINKTQSQNPQQSFGIIYKNKCCGIISLIVQDDVYKNSAEIGYWIGEPYWGKGITTQAIDLITRYGFEKLNLLRIYAGIFEYNIASMKILEKNGYIKEGVFQKAIVKNGSILDEHRYFILNTNHPSTNKKEQ